MTEQEIKIKAASDVVNGRYAEPDDPHDARIYSSAYDHESERWTEYGLMCAGY